MNRVFQELPKIIRNSNPDLRLSFDFKNKTIKIKEDSIDAKLKDITLKGFEDNVFAFKLDSKKIERICNVIDNNIPVNKACDAVIFSEIGKKNYIFICELKSDYPSGFIEQFKSTNSFLDYLSSILLHFYDIEIESFKRVNILFTSRISKQTVGTSYKRSKIYSQKKINILEENNCKKPSDLKYITKFI